MSRENQNTLMSWVLVILLVLFLCSLAACGSDNDPAQPGVTIVAVDQVGAPVPDADVKSYCDAFGFRVYLSDVYYGNSVAVVADPVCALPTTTVTP